MIERCAILWLFLFNGALLIALVADYLRRISK